MAHIPVLLKEVLEHFDPRPGQYFIDTTAGEGGHAIEIAKLVAPTGQVLAIEWDSAEFKSLRENIEAANLNQYITIVNENFANLVKIFDKINFPFSHGILFDLGMSGWHIELSKRGFSFQGEEQLDMRYNPQDNTRATAADILSSWSKDDLEYIFREFAEEKNAARIALAIVRARRGKKKIKTTKDLVEIIMSVASLRGKIHPATKIFQALRIAVNGEFENIEIGLEGALKIVRGGGKIIVISFHSLEDRIVKNKFKTWENENKGVRVNKKVIMPSHEEILRNRRSRSAKLRVFQKI